MGKPEVATILVTFVYWKKFFTPIPSFGALLVRKIFLWGMHSSQDSGKPEVAAIQIF
jgi:hypothetical protein